MATLSSINLNNVTRVDWNGGEDNITQIRLKKGNADPVVIWERSNIEQAIFRLPFFHDSYRGNGFLIPRTLAVSTTPTSSRFGRIPEVIDGGYGYRVGQVIRVNVPNSIIQPHSFLKVGTNGQNFATRHWFFASDNLSNIYFITPIGGKRNNASPDFNIQIRRVQPSSGFQSGQPGATGAITQFTIYQNPDNTGTIANYTARRYDIFRQKFTQAGGFGDTTFLRANNGQDPVGAFFNMTTTAQSPEGIEVTAPPNTFPISHRPGIDVGPVPDGWIGPGPAGQYFDPNGDLPDYWDFWISDPEGYLNQQSAAGQYNNPQSDVRIKENIDFIRLSNSGLKIYEFNFAHKPGRYQGVIAQDLLEIDSRHPAIITNKNNGYYHVDYDQIDVEFKKIN